jgi:hypothetical protein
MATRRTEDDLLNTDRVLFQMVRDYSDGLLGRGQTYYSARVEHSDPEGAKLERSPPNPARSVRARVYSAGLDATTPIEALIIFYPLNQGGCPQPGEHVLVSFEDEAMTSGYWHSIVPAFHDSNYANPDLRQASTGDASHTFEGDPKAETATPTAFEYGGSTTQTEGRQEIVDIAEAQSETNPWQGKKVLAIGDSQMAGPFGIALGNSLRGQYGVAQYVRDGRQGWGVPGWLRGTQTPTSPRLATLRELVAQHQPDILVISLGGNDGGSAAGQADYDVKIRELITQAQGVGLIIWSGPPTAVGPRGGPKQTGRDVAARKILEVLGTRFVDIRTITNTTVGRRDDGVHFLRGAAAIEPWVEMVIRRAYQLQLGQGTR